MESAVRSREIELVYHFSRFENIDSIMKNGIIPRARLEANDIEFEFNDSVRLDGQLDASCFSIHWPNYKMFYRLRCENPRQEWVIIGLTRSILWEKDCAFCCTNAASPTVSRIPIELRKGSEAFGKLFEPISGKATREALRLPKSFPTDPQAEVLVFDIVEPKYIVHLICEKPEIEGALQTKYPKMRVVNQKNLFFARFDHAEWK